MLVNVAEQTILLGSLREIAGDGIRRCSMRGYIFGAVLAAGLVASGSVWAEDDVDFEKEMQNIELQKKQMDLQQRQAEMEFQQELRNLELEQKRTELDRQRKMMEMMPPGGPQMKQRIQCGMSGLGCPGMRAPGSPCEMPPAGPGCPSMKGPGDGCGGCPNMKGSEGPDKRLDIRRDGDKFHHGPPRCCRLGMAVMLLGMCVIHILLAVWVSKDIRQRNSGSGIWVVIALLAGLMGALVYAVVRIGDSKTA